MVFSSYSFILLFLPIVLAGFAVAAKLPGRRVPFVWLIVCSLIYCGYWRLGDLLPLAVSILCNFTIGRLLIREGMSRGLSRLVFLLGLIFNLAMLGWFKYAGMFVETTNTLFGVSWRVPAVVLPIAISFYTFQQIAYLFDAKNGLTREHQFIDYCLFVTFFPQLIAGPIVHHRDVLPQFYKKRLAFDPSNLAIGVSLFVFGLSKKVLIADELALMVGKAFTGSVVAGGAGGGEGMGAGGMGAIEVGGMMTFGTAWLGAIAYTLQIYFDFSGYSDMAMGLGRMFGVRLPLNFNSPYRATSVIEFWRRWHITLSVFLRDYLYIPLGGNRRGKVMRYGNLMITMLLGGMWHGASWVFVLWGGMHGLYLMVNHGWRAVFGRREMGVVGLVWCRGVTFVAVVVAWVLFRAADLGEAGRFMRAMSGVDGFGGGEHVYKPLQVVLLAVLLGVVFVLPNVQVMMRRYKPQFGKQLVWDGIAGLNGWRWRPEMFWFAVQGVLLVACLVQISRGGEFIYYRF